jgi:hypothetical protein
MPTQRYTKSITPLVWQHLANKYMVHGSLSEHRIFSLISCLTSFFCGSFYIIRLLFSFFFQPLTIIQSVQWLGLEPASRDSIPGNDKIFIFHKASIHCDEIIAIPITSFFRFWRKSLKDLHEAWTNMNSHYFTMDIIDRLHFNLSR